MSNYELLDSTVENELRDNGAYASVTKGTSMRPLFKTNRDVVYLKRCDTEPKKYDVVLYKSGEGKYVLHRIVRILPDRFVIRGDNTFLPEYVAKDRILAVMTEYNRGGKRRSTDYRGYRIYSRLWNFIYPVRFVCHKLLSVLRAVYRSIFKRNK